MNKEQIKFIIKNISEYNNEYSQESLDAQERIFSNVWQSLRGNTFHFDKMETLHLNQNGKKRIVKQYRDLLSVENILSIYIKKLLDRKFRVTYPNRNKIIKSLFNIISAIVQMENFTIVRFDFKDYFNTISSKYVFEKYIKDRISNRNELYLVKNYVEATKFAYAGLCTSNVIAEIISRYFDKNLYQSLLSHGIIFYERYIDDGILIFNDHVEKDEIIDILHKTISKVFKDNSIKCRKCKTKFNLKKFQYVSKQNLSPRINTAVNFLGYEFFFSKNSNVNKIDSIIKYGIADEKRKKYEKKLDKLISFYTQAREQNPQELELLRHRIATFSSRQVYITHHKNQNTWHVKGFISNYGELRFFLKAGLLESKTEYFLRNMILDAFKRAKLMPYFLKGDSSGSYNLYTNMKLNKTFLFVQNIGYDYQSLVKLCKKIGINNLTSDYRRRNYNSLVKEYLIKVKVGY